MSKHQTRFYVQEEVCTNEPEVYRRVKEAFPGFRHKVKDDYALCLQWGTYMYGDGAAENGFRFIWRTPDNKLLPARGQARISSLKIIEVLIEIARERGWGDNSSS